MVHVITHAISFSIHDSKVLSPVPEGYEMNGPSGQDIRQQDPHTDPSLRPASRIRTQTLPNTPSRAAPHELYLDQRRATQGHQPHLSDQEDLRRRSILISLPRHTRPPPCHRYVPLRTRRLSSPDGVLLSLKTPESHGTR